MFEISSDGSLYETSLEQLFEREPNIEIGQRLGLSYVRSQEEELNISVANKTLPIQQCNAGLISISTVAWDAGIYLVDFLSTVYFKHSFSLSSITSNPKLGNVLELGCGTGISGLSCRYLGATQITLTDCFQSIVLTQNIQHLKELKGNENTIDTLENSCGIDFVQHDWASINISNEFFFSSNPSDASKANWDTVIGGDILYDSKHHKSLDSFLKKLSFSKLILSFKRRHDEHEILFFKNLSEWCNLFIVNQENIEVINLSPQSLKGLYIMIAIPKENINE